MTDRHSYQLELAGIVAGSLLLWAAIGYSVLLVLR